MHIAVCDDEKDIAKLFSKKIKELEPESQISIFTRGMDLIQSDELWDVAFIDIEMEPINGFEVAAAIKEKQQNCVYSFITTHFELAVDGYDYQPFRYILKSAPEPVVNRKIAETINEYYVRSRILNISYKGVYRNIAVRDIQCIEIEGHCMKIVLQDEEVLWGKTLTKIESELKKYGLIRCHRSFMVSLPHIKEIVSSVITLNNGRTIPIGRSYKKIVSESYKNYAIV